MLTPEQFDEIKIGIAPNDRRRPQPVVILIHNSQAAATPSAGSSMQSIVTNVIVGLQAFGGPRNDRMVSIATFDETVTPFYFNAWASTIRTEAVRLSFTLGTPCANDTTPALRWAGEAFRQCDVWVQNNPVFFNRPHSWEHARVRTTLSPASLAPLRFIFADHSIAVSELELAALETCRVYGLMPRAVFVLFGEGDFDTRVAARCATQSMCVIRPDELIEKHWRSWFQDLDQTVTS